VENTEGGGRWGECEGEEEGWRLPKRKLLGSRPVLRLTFSSAEEARRRMVLLLVRTYFPRTRDPVRMMNVETAARQMYAIYIQAVFRGFLTRRWWRLVTEFLWEQLGTTFLEQRRACRSAVADDLSKIPEVVLASSRKLNISHQALLRYIEWMESMRIGSGRAPKQRQPRHCKVGFHPVDLTNVVELKVGAPPLAELKAYGGGLPGTITQDKKAFVNAMRREKECIRDHRWLVEMMDVKAKCDRKRKEHDRDRAQAALRSQPDRMNMRIFEILQPRPEKVRGHSSVLFALSTPNPRPETKP
jgi:hypothetical protein